MCLHCRHKSVLCCSVCALFMGLWVSYTLFSASSLCDKLTSLSHIELLISDSVSDCFLDACYLHERVLCLLSHSRYSSVYNTKLMLSFDGIAIHVYYNLDFKDWFFVTYVSWRDVPHLGVEQVCCYITSLCVHVCVPTYFEFTRVLLCVTSHSVFGSAICMSIISLPPATFYVQVLLLAFPSREWLFPSLAILLSTSYSALADVGVLDNSLLIVGLT